MNDPEPHIHIERIDPKTGEVLQNYHLYWQRYLLTMAYEVVAQINPPSNRHVALNLAGPSVERFALGVCLLKEQLVSSIWLRDSANWHAIQLSRDERLAPNEVDECR